MTTTRAKKVQLKRDFDYYTKLNTFMNVFLSTPECGSFGRVSEEFGNQAPVKAIFEVTKLDEFDRENTDPYCAMNYYFIYTAEIEDMKNKKQWLIGPLTTQPFWANRKISTSIPCITKYPDGETNPCMFRLHAYIGEVTDIYTTIKRACLTGEGATFWLDSPYEISYDSSKNQFHIGTDFFYPHFPCKVSDFIMESGENLVYVNYKNFAVSVLT